MSVPRNHHYLPQWYLERWARNGTVVRYVRPRGEGGKLDIKRKAPGAIAYERDLYQLTDVEDPVASQHLELNFFQRIDDRAAIAFRKADAGIRGSLFDRVALSQFIISLLHRSPSRLREMQAELLELPDAPYGGISREEAASLGKAHANRLLADLVESRDGANIVSRFKTFVIKPAPLSRFFVTSERPISASAQMIAPDAFLAFPYAPDALMVLTHNEEIARAFATQKPDALVHGINSAIVEQSQELIIAVDERATPMIERLFLVPRPGAVRDTIGLIRRKSPFVDVLPRARRFSRHDKRSMQYLGR